eukprot:7922040-Alexandrium_andersonii.AAC.1
MALGIRLTGTCPLQGPQRCNPQSAHGPPVPVSASLRSPPCGELQIASGDRSLNCAGPETTSKVVPMVPE